MAGVSLNSLPLFHRITGQTVIVLGDGEAAAAKQRLVERAGGVVSNDPTADAKLAFVAHDQPEAVTATLKARGLLVNVVDRPDLCDFTVPSLLERGPVLVAVGTGGVSAGLAKALRLRLEGLLPQSLSQLAEALGSARSALRARWSDAADRRRALDDALATGAALDPFADYRTGAVEQWLDRAEQTAHLTQTITLNSDDPDDLTLRQARWLGSADLVLHDATVPATVLNRARADAMRAVLQGSTQQAKLHGLTVIIRRR